MDYDATMAENTILPPLSEVVAFCVISIYWMKALLVKLLQKKSTRELTTALDEDVLAQS